MSPSSSLTLSNGVLPPAKSSQNTRITSPIVVNTGRAGRPMKRITSAAPITAIEKPAPNENAWFDGQPLDHQQRPRHQHQRPPLEDAARAQRAGLSRRRRSRARRGSPASPQARSRHRTCRTARSPRMNIPSPIAAMTMPSTVMPSATKNCRHDRRLEQHPHDVSNRARYAANSPDAPSSSRDPQCRGSRSRC